MNRKPEEISMLELKGAYATKRKFREYVDAVASHGSRLKSIDEVLENKMVRYYYLSLLPGGCNEEREDKGK